MLTADADVLAAHDDSDRKLVVRLLLPVRTRRRSPKYDNLRVVLTVLDRDGFLQRAQPSPRLYALGDSTGAPDSSTRVS